ncbi:hypothetical protein ACFX2F_002701 [Malus domestica]
MMEKHYLIAVLILVPCLLLRIRCATAQVGYSGKEKDALAALKTSFNHPFLNANWTGDPCFMSQPSMWYGIQCTNFSIIGRVTGIVLDSMELRSNIKLDAFMDFTELATLSLKNNSLWGNMMDFSLNLKLTHIDMSGNILHGEISHSLLSLGMLELLLLQDNDFGGPIPEFNQLTLRAFNISNNNLSGLIPTTHALQAFGYDSFSGNAGLCGPPSSILCNSSSTVRGIDNPASGQVGELSSSKSEVKLSVYWFLLDVAALVVVILLFLLYYKKSQKLKKMMKQLEMNKSASTNQDEKGEVGDDKDKRIEEGRQDQTMKAAEVEGQDQHKRGKLEFVQPHGADDHQIFEMGDLLKASAESLGNGIFGNSYKAEIVTMNNVAGNQIKQSVVVKRLRDLKPLVSEDFTKQLQVIASLKHPNLLPLLAYFFSKNEKLLLYKYIRKGNLFNRLFGKRVPDRIPFGWRSRLIVAQGVARALEYLHRNATSSIQSGSSSSSTSTSTSTAPHGNLKSTNVLLDDNDGVLVSDYGFASVVAIPVATQRMVIYKSPEYQKSKKVSKASDVWSYGSLVLELLTGKISACTAQPGLNGVDLCSWVHRAVREEWTAEIFDREITMHRRASSDMVRLLKTAMRCCDPSPEKRPGMDEIVRELENIRVTESEVDEDESSSLDQSLTDESVSATALPARYK